MKDHMGPTWVTFPTLTHRCLDPDACPFTSLILGLSPGLLPLTPMNTVQGNSRRDLAHLDHISFLYHVIYIHEMQYLEITFGKTFP